MKGLTMASRQHGWRSALETLRGRCRHAVAVAATAAALAATGCAGPTGEVFTSTPGTELERAGDEIVVAGRHFHTGTRVVLWTEPDGYDAYRVERRFAPIEEAGWDASKGTLGSPNRFGTRAWPGMTDEDREAVRSGGWDLPRLQHVVDQFVVHYDVCGVSQQCFNILHDHRGLSVHFLLDIDGTIYQTMDVQEKAWHATRSNSRSVGIEIANMGAYGTGEDDPFDRWYAVDEDGRVRITVPPSLGDGGVRTPNFVGRPARNGLVIGEVQGRTLRQYDLTPEQYEALPKLIATLNRALPKMVIEAPRDERGNVMPGVLTDEAWRDFAGVIAHYHIQSNKVDPGPAFQWERVLDEARWLRAKMPAGSPGGSVLEPPGR